MLVVAMLALMLRLIVLRRGRRVLLLGRRSRCALLRRGRRMILRGVIELLRRRRDWHMLLSLRYWQVLRLLHAILRRTIELLRRRRHMVLGSMILSRAIELRSGR
jgi:hypothetical protein